MAIRRLGLQGDKISIRDLSKEEDKEVKDQVFYDACDERDDSEEDLTEAIEKKVATYGTTERVLLPPRNMMNKSIERHRRKREGHTKG